MNLILTFFFMILGVGFFMLLERKILGIIHFRLGPNKVLLKGWFQFLKDLLKLIFKSLIELKSFYLYWLFTVIVLLFLIQLVMWMLLPFESLYTNIKFSTMILILILLVKLIFLMSMIWMVYSIYSTMSVYRMLVQMISSDMIIIVVFLMMIFLVKSFMMICFSSFKIMIFFLSIMISLFWIIGILIEVIRLPYDFFESESELISGFTIEMGSIIFLFMILIEYLEMIYFLFVFSIFFFNLIIIKMNFYLSLGMLSLILVFFRGIFIRHRFDKMMFFLWKVVFLLGMGNMLVIFVLSFV